MRKLLAAANVWGMGYIIYVTGSKESKDSILIMIGKEASYFQLLSIPMGSVFGC